MLQERELQGKQLKYSETRAELAWKKEHTGGVSISYLQLVVHLEVDGFDVVELFAQLDGGVLLLVDVLL